MPNRLFLPILFAVILGVVAALWFGHNAGPTPQVLEQPVDLGAHAQQ